MTRKDMTRMGVAFLLVVGIIGCSPRPPKEVAVGKSECKWTKSATGESDLVCTTSSQVITIRAAGLAKCDSTGMGVGC
jgi:hypothetical protein